MNAWQELYKFLVYFRVKLTRALMKHFKELNTGILSRK